MKVMFIGAPVDAPPAHLTTEQKLDATGKNTGNMLIGQALKRQLRLTHYEQYKAGMSPDWIVGNFDLIAIPASNFLFRNFDFGGLGEK